MSTDFAPSWYRDNDLLHLTYDVPERIHHAVHYPVNSSNGSSIISYGHERGVTFLWRGGRPIDKKRQRRPSTHSTADNFDSQDAVMVDATDKEAEVQTDLDEQNDEESSHTYDRIISSLELDLNTAVHKIATVSVPRDTATRHRDSVPAVFERKLVVVVACADRSVRMLIVSLYPEQSQRLKLGKSLGHRGVKQSFIPDPQLSDGSLPRDLHLTYTSMESKAYLSDYAYSDEEENENGQKIDNVPSHASTKTEPSWGLLLLSLVTEPVSALQAWRLPFINEPDNLTLSGPRVGKPPINTFLPASCSSISFSPSRYPSPRHNQFLFVEAHNAIRICEIPVETENITFLASFCPPFQDSAHASPKKMPEFRRVLDAQWALGGKVIVVLLSDGTWGVWDLEGVGPTTPSHGNKPAIPSPGITGGGVTRFILQGSVGDTQIGQFGIRSSDASNGKESRGPSTLAPMTPKTRKVKQENLFRGPAPTVTRSEHVRGGISTAAAPHSATRKSADESLIFWYGTQIYRIPSLMSYWQHAANSAARSRDSANNSTLAGPRIKQTLSLSTGGERMTSISHFARSTESTTSEIPRYDVVASAEHRLVILCPARAETPPAPLRTLFKPPEAEISASRVDQDLLSKEELGLDGIDRLLDGMADGEKPATLFGQPAKRRVEFAVNH